MTRQERMLADRATVDGIERGFERLSLELRLETERRHLDTLLELVQVRIRTLEPTHQRAAYQERLERVSRIVSTRHHLRLVKGNKP